MGRKGLGRRSDHKARRTCCPPHWLAVVQRRSCIEEAKACLKLQQANASRQPSNTDGADRTAISHIHCTHVCQADSTHFAEERPSHIGLHSTLAVATATSLPSTKSTGSMLTCWLRFVRLQQPPACASDAVRLWSTQHFTCQGILLRHDRKRQVDSQTANREGSARFL